MSKDAITDPTDQDRFVAFRHGDGHQLQVRVLALEESIRTKLEGRIQSLEAMMPTVIELMKQHMDMKVALAKQRAVNEELWAWFRDDCRDPISEDLCAAISNALK